MLCAAKAAVLFRRTSDPRGEGRVSVGIRMELTDRSRPTHLGFSVLPTGL